MVTKLIESVGALKVLPYYLFISKLIIGLSNYIQSKYLLGSEKPGMGDLWKIVSLLESPYERHIYDRHMESDQNLLR